MPYKTDIDAADLMPGDRIYLPLHDGAVVRVLRAGEPWRDLFGREMTRYWCVGESGEAEGREGFMTYGPGARVTLSYR